MGIKRTFPWTSRSNGGTERKTGRGEEKEKEREGKPPASTERSPVSFMDLHIASADGKGAERGEKKKKGGKTRNKTPFIEEKFLDSFAPSIRSRGAG